jgi:hypothetical protein
MPPKSLASPNPFLEEFPAASRDRFDPFIARSGRYKVLSADSNEIVRVFRTFLALMRGDYTAPAATNSGPQAGVVEIAADARPPVRSPVHHDDHAARRADFVLTGCCASQPELRQQRYAFTLVRVISSSLGVCESLLP